MKIGAAILASMASAEQFLYCIYGKYTIFLVVLTIAYDQRNPISYGPYDIHRIV